MWLCWLLQMLSLVECMLGNEGEMCGYAGCYRCCHWLNACWEIKGEMCGYAGCYSVTTDIVADRYKTQCD